MARPLRLDYPGAWHHVINRGTARQAIFSTDEQRAYFLSLLAATHERFNAEWHAYCLMSNHYHLLLRTPEANLQRIMRHVGGLYTQFYNRTEGRDGPLMRAGAIERCWLTPSLTGWSCRAISTETRKLPVWSKTWRIILGRATRLILAVPRFPPGCRCPIYLGRSRLKAAARATRPLWPVIVMRRCRHFITS